MLELSCREVRNPVWEEGCVSPHKLFDYKDNDKGRGVRAAFAVFPVLSLALPHNKHGKVEMWLFPHAQESGLASGFTTTE